MFDALASAAGQACGLATTAALWGGIIHDDNATSVAVDIAFPTQHGDQQTSFAAETTFGGRVQLGHLVWVQVDRALVRIVVTNQAAGATNPDPSAILETTLNAAVESIAAELAAG